MRISWDTGIHNGIHVKMATYLFVYPHDKAIIGVDIGYKWTIFSKPYGIISIYSPFIS